MQNFDELANIPGVIFKKFCSFDCSNEATGDINLGPDDQSPPLPICESCVEKLEEHIQKLIEQAKINEQLLDTGKFSVLD